MMMLVEAFFASSCRTSIAIDEAKKVMKNATQSEPCKNANDAQANPTIKITNHLL